MEYPTPVILAISSNIVFNLVPIKSKMALLYQLTDKDRTERALYN